MFSRVGRLTTFGAHAISNFRRDKNYLPQRAQASSLAPNDNFVNFAHHTFSNTIRPRTSSDSSSSNADPFLGVLSNDEREVIKELELLDLDSWNGANPIAGSLQNPELPSSSGGSMEPHIDYQMTGWTNNPRFGCDELCNDDFEDWTSVVREHDQNVAAISSANLPLGITHHYHSNEPEGFPSFESVQQHMHHNQQQLQHQQPNCSHNYSLPHQPSHQNQNQNQQQQQSVTMTPRFENMKNFESDIDNASKLVDWDAWSRYLAEDEQIVTSSGALAPTSSPAAPPTPPHQKHQEMDSFSYVNYLSSVPKLETTTPISRLDAPAEDVYVPNVDVKQEEVSRVNSPWLPYPGQDQELFQSGPLIYVPKSSPRDDTSSVYSGSGSRKLRNRRAFRSTDSERSWTPASDDYYPDEKPKYKKRGVIVKPSVDEETDRRRALNRVAAIRYREKKRVEKMARNKEYQEVLHRNKYLRQQEKQLAKEIAEMRRKLKRHNHQF